MLLLLLLQQLYLHFALGVLRESDLELVMEELRGVEEKWEHVGRELRQQTTLVNKVYQYSPDDIRSRCSAAVDCLRETISQWLQCTNFPTPTWGIIIVALRKAGEPHLADNLKAKYLPGELTTTTSSQHSLESQHEECILLYCD